MTKTELLGFIGKYSLSGNVESVTWKSDINSITTNFVSTDKTLKGSVSAKIGNIPDKEIGIYNTSQLIRMLSILDEDIHLTTSDTSLMIQDKHTDFSFVLADLDVIPKVPKLKMTPSFTSNIKITDDFINKFVKSHGALPENDFFTVECDAISKQVTFGYSNTNSNRISFNIEVEGEDIQPIHFSSGLMREILVANKGIHGSIEISPVGLCRVKFNTSTYSAEYYLVSKEIGE
tara:strand:- start:29818 stop:30516 length:699 start_codon:yes stop_codon:yes gene_type:complete